MKQNFLVRLWVQAWSLILVEMSRQELGWLMSGRHHLSLLTTRRTTMIVSRVRLVAGIFGVLTPLWILIDIYTFDRAVWVGLVAARLVATAAFFSLLRLPRRMDALSDAYKALAMLLAIPSLFFLFTYHHMAGLKLHGVQEAFAVGYAFLPFVMLAGLSVFPLTLLECLICAAPILLSQAITSLLGSQVFDWPTAAASFWLLLLITGVSAMAGISQLGFIIVLMREAVRDSLTGCFSRRSGEELLDLQFRLAERHQAPLALAFFDLDHFKGINDRYGHDAGDQALRSAAANIRDQARATDVLIRWGGEEFLLLMPGTDLQGARIALERLRAKGIGQRPDGTALTASIGVAERGADGAAYWQGLITTADSRMYQAKQSGRDRIVG
jgi:diguanylate cyclase (GGDEF)-like protein